jgi:hypothetical protein
VSTLLIATGTTGSLTFNIQVGFHAASPHYEVADIQSKLFRLPQISCIYSLTTTAHASSSDYVINKGWRRCRQSIHVRRRIELSFTLLDAVNEPNVFTHAEESDDDEPNKEATFDRGDTGQKPILRRRRPFIT